jgi:hypothetical protein
MQALPTGEGDSRIIFVLSNGITSLEAVVTYLKVPFRFSLKWATLNAQSFSWDKHATLPLHEAESSLK